MFIKSNMIKSSRSFVTCVLCEGALPSTKNEFVEAHFQEQHRSYFNIDFLFQSSHLREDEILVTLEFMQSLTLDTNVVNEPSTINTNDSSTNSDEDPSTNKYSFQNHQYSKIVEVEIPSNEQNDRKNNTFLDKYSPTLHQPATNSDTETSANETLIDGFSITLYDPIEDLDMFSSRIVEKGNICKSELGIGHKKLLNEKESKALRSNVKIFPVAKYDNDLDTSVSENGDLIFHCCNKSYTSKQKLRAHQTETHDVREKICEICKKEFLGAKRLRNHMRDHTYKTCKSCDQKFPNSNYKRHAENCALRVCNFCNFKTFRRKVFKYHKCYLHMKKKIVKIKNEDVYKCDLCKYTTKKKAHFNRHESIVHSSKHKCTYCKKKFNSSTVLDRHVTNAHMENVTMKLD